MQRTRGDFKSSALDLQRPEQRDLRQALCAHADVCGYAQGALTKLYALSHLHTSSR